MLHCFQCGADLPDNLVYCVHCGARLEDPDATTVVDPPIVIPIDPRPSPVESTPFPVDPRPAPTEPKRSGGVLKFIIGGVLGAGAVIVLLAIVGSVIYYMSEQGQGPANNGRSAVSTPTPVPTPTATTTPASAPTRKPTPMLVNANDETEAAAKSCEIINPAGGSVNLRRYCDTRDCSLDASTLYTQGDPGDLVQRMNHKPVTSGRFTWVQVKFDGETLWISSNRINCE
ncbi:MAG: hypothetical protein ABJB40_00195 [Acidobacteriota bacterium]